MHDERRRAARGEQHGGKIAQRVISELLVQTHVDRKRRLRHEQRVAVGSGLGDELEADVAAATRPVVDQHLLAPAHGEALRERAREDVGCTARSDRDDEAHGLRGIALRVHA